MKVRTGYSGRDVRGRPTGPTWSENVPTLDLASYPQTPLERRIATPEELAQRAAADAERTRPVLPAPRPAPPVIPAGATTLRHSVSSTDPVSSGNLAEPTAVPDPIPSPVEEITMPIAAIAPPETVAVPCGTCLHAPVCGLKASIPVTAGEPFAITAGYPDGVRMFVTAFRVDCDHHLVSLKPVPVEPIRVEREGESWRSPMVIRTATADELEPRRHQSKKGEAAEKAERAAAVLAAVARHGGDRRAAAAELGMRPNALAMVLKFAAGHAPAEPEAVAS